MAASKLAAAASAIAGRELDVLMVVAGCAWSAVAAYPRYHFRLLLLLVL
jgi:hypothetical protein